MEKLARFLLGFVLVIVALIFSGFVLAKLWGWFVVYAFDISSISIPVAIGLVLVGSKITGSIRNNEESGYDLSKLSEMGMWFVRSIVLQGVFLLFGWIITWFL